jgi:single-strand DNA-binding protein
MADLNTLDLTGRLTRDPELRTTPAGKSVCNFRVACNGMRDEDTVFIDVDVWGDSAAACAQYLRQGSRVAVSGRLGIRDWQSQDGENRRSVECNFARAYFLETKAESEQHGASAAVPPPATPTMPPPPGAPAQQAMPAQPAGAPADDDIPF